MGKIKLEEGFNIRKTTTNEDGITTESSLKTFLDGLPIKTKLTIAIGTTLAGEMLLATLFKEEILLAFLNLMMHIQTLANTLKMTRP